MSITEKDIIKYRDTGNHKNRVGVMRLYDQIIICDCIAYKIFTFSALLFNMC